MNTAAAPAHVPSRLWERITSQKERRAGEVFFKNKESGCDFICKFYKGHDADADRVLECLKACAWFEHPVEAMEMIRIEVDAARQIVNDGEPDRNQRLILDSLNLVMLLLGSVK